MICQRQGCDCPTTQSRSRDSSSLQTNSILHIVLHKKYLKWTLFDGETLWSVFNLAYYSGLFWPPWEEPLVSLPPPSSVSTPAHSIPPQPPPRLSRLFSTSDTFYRQNVGLRTMRGRLSPKVPPQNLVWDGKGEEAFA